MGGRWTSVGCTILGIGTPSVRVTGIALVLEGAEGAIVHECLVLTPIPYGAGGSSHRIGKELPAYLHREVHAISFALKTGPSVHTRA